MIAMVVHLRFMAKVLVFIFFIDVHSVLRAAPIGPFRPGRRGHQRAQGGQHPRPRHQQREAPHASGDGQVVRADNYASGYGKHIRIDHGYGYLTVYAHLSKYNVKKGQKVKRGDLIGFVGSTGRSEAPHLHYEVWKDGNKINPINFYYGSLTAEEFENMLKIATQENQSLD